MIEPKNMDTSTISRLFSGNEGGSTALNYLETELNATTWRLLSNKQVDGRIPPNYRDLARLHHLVRSRHVFTVMECGLGFSTIVIADALLKNKNDWNALKEKPRIRNSTFFQIHSVDASEMWIGSTKAMLSEELSAIIHFYCSDVEAGTFHGRACHYYKKLPDVVPDLIYLDGPDPADVKGSVGVGWSNPDRVVMSADILRIEPWLLPGCLVVVDGRSANARFLSEHLYRKWDVSYDSSNDVTVMELQEQPLGKINMDTLLHCLGRRILDW